MLGLHVHSLDALMTGCVTSVAPHRNVLCLEKVQCFGNLRDVKQKYLLCILVKVNPWPPCLPLSLEDSLIFVLFIILGLELIRYGNISTPLFYYCCEHFYLSGFCDLALYFLHMKLNRLFCVLCANFVKIILDGWYSTTWLPLILCACSYTTSHQSFPPGKVQSMPGA